MSLIALQSPTISMRTNELVFLVKGKHQAATSNSQWLTCLCELSLIPFRKIPLVKQPIEQIADRDLLTAHKEAFQSIGGASLTSHEASSLRSIVPVFPPHCLIDLGRRRKPISGLTRGAAQGIP